MESRNLDESNSRNINIRAFAKCLVSHILNRCLFLSDVRQQESKTLSCINPIRLSIVAWRHQQVSEDRQLVFSQLFFVFRPVVLVRPLELLEHILHSGGDWL